MKTPLSLCGRPQNFQFSSFIRLTVKCRLDPYLTDPYLILFFFSPTSFGDQTMPRNQTRILLLSLPMSYWGYLHAFSYFMSCTPSLIFGFYPGADGPKESVSLSTNRRKIQSLIHQTRPIPKPPAEMMRFHAEIVFNSVKNEDPVFSLHALVGPAFILGKNFTSGKFSKSESCVQIKHS